MEAVQFSRGFVLTGTGDSSVETVGFAHRRAWGGRCYPGSEPGEKPSPVKSQFSLESPLGKSKAALDSQQRRQTLPAKENRPRQSESGAGGRGEPANLAIRGLSGAVGGGGGRGRSFSTEDSGQGAVSGGRGRFWTCSFLASEKEKSFQPVDVSRRG